MSGEQDPLIKIAGDVGYMRGAFDGMKKQNEDDHKEIKQRLKDGDEKFTEICNEVKAQAQRHEDLEGRVDKVEKDQKVIAGLAAFVISHPRLILGIAVVFIVAITGLSADEVWKIINGGG